MALLRMTMAAILESLDEPVLFSFCCSWTWQIETSHRPPTPKTLLPGSPPNPCPNPHVYGVNTLITAFSSHHLDHSPFAPRECHFGHILQQFVGVIEVALFPLITVSLLMVHAGLCLDDRRWTLWNGSHHGVYVSHSRCTPDLVILLIFFRIDRWFSGAQREGGLMCI